MKKYLLNVDDALWRRVRIYCAEQSITVREFILRAIQKMLEVQK